VKIPNRFKLFSTTIEVKFDESKFTFEEEAYCGFASYRDCAIYLKPSTKVRPVSSHQIQQTFMHELFHFIFYYSGCAYKGKVDYMHQEEDFVDLSASLMLQAMSTMEYDK